MRWKGALLQSNCSCEPSTTTQILPRLAVLHHPLVGGVSQATSHCTVYLCRIVVVVLYQTTCRRTSLRSLVVVSLGCPKGNKNNSS